MNSLLEKTIGVVMAIDDIKGSQRDIASFFFHTRNTIPLVLVLAWRESKDVKELICLARSIIDFRSKHGAWGKKSTKVSKALLARLKYKGVSDLNPILKKEHLDGVLPLLLGISVAEIWEKLMDTEGEAVGWVELNDLPPLWLGTQRRKDMGFRRGGEKEQFRNTLHRRWCRLVEADDETPPLVLWYKVLIPDMFKDLKIVVFDSIHNANKVLNLQSTLGEEEKDVGMEDRSGSANGLYACGDLLKNLGLTSEEVNAIGSISSKKIVSYKKLFPSTCGKESKFCKIGLWSGILETDLPQLREGSMRVGAERDNPVYGHLAIEYMNYFDPMASRAGAVYWAKLDLSGSAAVIKQDETKAKYTKVLGELLSWGVGDVGGEDYHIISCLPQQIPDEDSDNGSTMLQIRAIIHHWLKRLTSCVGGERRVS